MEENDIEMPDRTVTMTRRSKVVILPWVSLACIVLLISVAWLLHEPQIAIARIDSKPLTDLEAVELSREALRRSGHETDRLAPQKFQHGNTNYYYSRNTVDPYGGYVLWSSVHWASTKLNNDGFIVKLEQRGTNVICRVCKPK